MSAMERFDSMKLLTSSASQYLPPDYLHPLPTTLDAKQSPLALLAQTCSSIGKDPPSKNVIPHIEKKDNSDKSTPVDNNNSNNNKPSVLKPKDGRVSSESHNTHSDRDDSKDISNFYPISTSSPKPAKSASVDVNIKMAKEECKKLMERESKTSPHVSRPSSSTSSGLKSYSDRASPRLKSVERSSSRETRDRDIRCSPPLKRQRSESPVRRDNSPNHDSKVAYSMYPGFPLGPYSYPGMHFGPGGFPATPESLAAAGYPFSFASQNGYGLASAHASALAAHHAAMKQQGSSAALAQYRDYVARMKHSAGIPLLGSAAACKDPYCTNCVSSQSHLPTQCTSPGCTQCSQEKKLQGLSHIGIPVSSALGSQYLGQSGLQSAGLSALHNLYAQSLLSQQQGHPHVCNWMSGSEYCGKRFTSSEELLQHLRTHTSGGDTSALSAYYSLGLGVPSPAELGAGLPGLVPPPGSLSPESLRRMYPSGLSALESSSAAALASRYHPYKSGLPPVPSGLPVHPSLGSVGPFQSPYSVYGQRIGSAVVP